MKALVVEGGTVRFREFPTSRPEPGEVLIKVGLAGICGTDLEILRGYGGYEGIPGHEFVGIVVGGSSALANKRVVGEINCVCGRCDMCSGGLANHCRRRTVLGIQGRPGAFAEYLTLPERNCHVLPDAVGDVEAVFTEPLAAAYQVLRQVPVEPRTRAAVVGTGRLGLLVAQVLAQTRCQLLAIGRNPRTLAFLDRRRIRVAAVSDVTTWQDQDVVVDCTGSPEGLKLAMRLVRPRGTIVLKTTCRAPSQADMSPLVVNEVKVVGSRCGPFADALRALAARRVEVAEMVTRRFPLREGAAAFEAAGQPDHIKVLLDVGG